MDRVTIPPPNLKRKSLNIVNQPIKLTAYITTSNIRPGKQEKTQTNKINSLYNMCLKYFTLKRNI